VDDGSRDATRAIVTRWIADTPQASLIAFDENRGLSAGYGAAFRFVRAEVAAGRLGASDLILTVDADGQHDPDDVAALVEALEREGLDGLMARRDFSLYPGYKKLGNGLMSVWATLWSGQRFYDVESGYRVFRAGPLGEATRYYEGYRYSETVELAMIFPRLGYTLGNNHRVPVPVYRSNTRMKDVIIDLIAMPLAWWRVMTQRNCPPGIKERWGPWLPGFFFALLLLVLLLVAVKRIFLGDDSASVYAHVWFIQDQLWSGHGIPRHIPALDGGRAVTFPYGLVPWLLGALIWPLFHDWGVTLLMVIAAVGTPIATCVARPVMRDPWVMLLFLLNPFYIDGLLAFQFPFLWSAFFFFLFVIALDRRWDVAAGGLLWLCITTHPLAGGIGALCYLATHFLSEPASASPCTRHTRAGGEFGAGDRLVHRGRLRAAGDGARLSVPCDVPDRVCPPLVPVNLCCLDRRANLLDCDGERRVRLRAGRLRRVVHTVPRHLRAVLRLRAVRSARDLSRDGAEPVRGRAVLFPSPWRAPRQRVLLREYVPSLVDGGRVS